MHFYTKFTKNGDFEVQKRHKTLGFLLDFIEYLDVLNIFRIFAEKLKDRKVVWSKLHVFYPTGH